LARPDEDLSVLLVARLMVAPAAVSRLTAYCTRHGLRSTIRRAALAVKRALFSNRMVLFYCDLSTQTFPPSRLHGNLTVERVGSNSELSSQDSCRIVEIWNPALAQRNLNERFGRKALLWLIKSEGRLAGYGWTLQGSTMEAHYFPLGGHDVHLFDFYVFSEYRGRGLNPLLVGEILRCLAAEGETRAFIEAAEWNDAQLSSLAKTPFASFGLARKWSIFGRTTVRWCGNHAREEASRGLADTFGTGPAHPGPRGLD
jgi:GNAT superfamily N-acetyltransferase